MRQELRLTFVRHVHCCMPTIAVVFALVSGLVILPTTSRAASLRVEPTGDLRPPAVLFEAASIDASVTVSGDRGADVTISASSDPVLDIVVEHGAPVVVPAGSGDVTVQVRLVARRLITVPPYPNGSVEPRAAVTFRATSSDPAWNDVTTSTQIGVLRAHVAPGPGFWWKYLEELPVALRATTIVTCPGLTTTQDGVVAHAIREGESIECWAYLQQPVEGTIGLRVIASPAARVTISEPTATFTAGSWRRVHRFTITARANGVPDPKREIVALGLELTDGGFVGGLRGDEGRIVDLDSDRHGNGEDLPAFWGYDEAAAKPAQWTFSYKHRLIGFIGVDDETFDPLLDVWPSRVRVREGGLPGIVWIRLRHKPPYGAHLRMRVDGTDIGNGGLEAFKDLAIDPRRWNWWYPVQFSTRDGIQPTRRLEAHPWIDMRRSGRVAWTWGDYGMMAIGDNTQHHPIPAVRVDVVDSDRRRRNVYNRGCFFELTGRVRGFYVSCTRDQGDAVGHIEDCRPRGSFTGADGTWKLYGTPMIVDAFARGRWQAVARTTPVFVGPDPVTGRHPALCDIHYQLGFSKWQLTYPAGATMLRLRDLGGPGQVPYSRHVRLDLARLMRPPSRPPWLR